MTFCLLKQLLFIIISFKTIETVRLALAKSIYYSYIYFNSSKSYGNRYSQMKYNRCGKSGLKLPAISLGLWHNFGGVDDFETSREMILRAFNLGITHFDLANNYGPPPGSAEENFGKTLHKDLKSYRDEMIISTKAGYAMWPGLMATGVHANTLLPA